MKSLKNLLVGISLAIVVILVRCFAMSVNRSKPGSDSCKLPDVSMSSADMLMGTGNNGNKVNNGKPCDIGISDIELEGENCRFKLTGFEEFISHGYGIAVCVARGGGGIVVRQEGKSTLVGGNILSLGDVLLYKRNENGEVTYYRVKDSKIYRIDLYSQNGINSIYTDVYAIPSDETNLSNVSFNINDCRCIYDDVDVCSLPRCTRREYMESVIDFWMSRYFSVFNNLDSVEFNTLFNNITNTLLSNTSSRTRKREVLDIFNRPEYTGKIIIDENLMKFVSELCG